MDMIIKDNTVGHPMGVEVRIVNQFAQAIRENIARVIVGKEAVVDLLLVALLCEGHVLIEDVPGIGKTTLAKALARSLDCSFRRIQFTPDLLPSDITGVNVFKTGEFEFRPGPVMAQIVLADEINRAGPRTQSALLEAMQERQVTADGITHPLPRPFLVLATQNPVELEGTFPLPEAQIDRFLLHVGLGYPDATEERAILRRFCEEDPLERLQPVVSADEVLAMGGRCRQVFVHEAVERYIVDIVRASRTSPEVRLGISPRGTLALYRTSQALAALRGRDYVIPDDVKTLAIPVLAHRLIPATHTRIKGGSREGLVAALLEQVPVPVEENWYAQ